MDISGISARVIARLCRFAHGALSVAPPAWWPVLLKGLVGFSHRVVANLLVTRKGSQHDLCERVAAVHAVQNLSIEASDKGF